jgi:hypothetical protein
MQSLICPLSPLRINRNVVRITGFLMASMIALYAITGSIYWIAAIGIDYAIRAFTPLPYSPFSWFGLQVANLLHLPVSLIDKAPKIFAARVGLLFALSTLLLYPLQPTASLVVGLTLMGFALLESVFDLCVGCLVYTYLVYPLFGEDKNG